MTRIKNDFNFVKVVPLHNIPFSIKHKMFTSNIKMRYQAAESKEKNKDFNKNIFLIYHRIISQRVNF